MEGTERVSGMLPALTGTPTLRNDGHLTSGAEPPLSGEVCIVAARLREKRSDQPSKSGPPNLARRVQFEALRIVSPNG